MAETQDLLGALRTYLLTDSALTALVGTRIYPTRLKRDESDDQPRKAVALRPGGGAPPTFARAGSPLEVQRIDCLCYGETEYEADRVRRALRGALRDLGRSAHNNTQLHWALPAGGKATGVDPDTEWPVTWESWQVMADEREVS